MANSPFVCSECNKPFGSKRTLKKHSFTHKILLSCHYCNKKFNRKDNLKRHLENVCPTSKKATPKAAKSPPTIFECGTCRKLFKRQTRLKYHLDKKSCASTEKTCPLCNYRDNILNVLNHFNIDHGIEIKHSELIFSNMEEFQAYKANIESITDSKFISQNKSCRKFFCHRSGEFKSKGKGLRHLKSIGSNKINGYCPANFTIRFKDEGKIIVDFVETHVGHECDLRRITLSKEERMYITSKIQANVPFDCILDDMRAQATKNKKRLNLLTKKDLFNIKRNLNLSDNNIQSECDAVSEETWVNLVPDSGGNIITLDEHGNVILPPEEIVHEVQNPNLQKEDYIFETLKEPQQVSSLDEEKSRLIGELALTVASISNFKQLEAAKILANEMLSAIQSVKDDGKVQHDFNILTFNENKSITPPKEKDITPSITKACTKKKRNPKQKTPEEVEIGEYLILNKNRHVYDC